jgi:lycopene cyclase domain-containing protein
VTYLQFHLVFILPPIALLALVLRGRRVVPSLGPLILIAGIAFLYTTPWDNYLVWRGVWGYGTERVLGIVGYVPVEEYAFFILQPILTGLWFHLVLSRAGPPARVPRQTRVVGGLLYGCIAAAGVFLLGTTSGLYAGLILAWAAPVLAGQWLYAGPSIWAHRRAFLPGVAVPTLYLWLADAYAIRSGIWEISDLYTIGLAIGGLPIEEALFFLVTNLLVVQGLILFLRPTSREVASPSRSAVAR